MTIHVRESDPDQWGLQLARGDVDLALVRQPEVVPSGFEFRPLLEDRFVVVCAPAHRMARRRDPRLADPLDLYLVAPGRGLGGARGSGPPDGLARRATADRAGAHTRLDAHGVAGPVAGRPALVPTERRETVGRHGATDRGGPAACSLVSSAGSGHAADLPTSAARLSPTFSPLCCSESDRWYRARDERNEGSPDPIKRWSEKTTTQDLNVDRAEVDLSATRKRSPARPAPGAASSASCQPGNVDSATPRVPAAP